MSLAVKQRAERQWVRSAVVVRESYGEGEIESFVKINILILNLTMLLYFYI